MRRMFGASSAAALLVLLAVHAYAARQQQTVPTVDCNAPLTYGAPTVPGNIQKVCYPAYTSFYDLDKKIPRLVVYHETADQSLGCLPRKKSFHSDAQVPPQSRAVPNEYLNTGYDLGHNVPDQDMAYDADRLNESFSTANIAPQKPKFNEQGWESLEEDVRAWALERGEVMIYVGSVVGPQPETIGSGVVVPRAFFKIVIDPKTSEVIGFLMNNVDTPKGDVTPYVTTISKIEEQSGITFALPNGIDKNKNVALWHTSTSDWRKKHKALCKGK